MLDNLTFHLFTDYWPGYNIYIYIVSHKFLGHMMEVCYQIVLISLATGGGGLLPVITMFLSVRMFTI